jgi:hypothetical protein
MSIKLLRIFNNLNVHHLKFLIRIFEFSTIQFLRVRDALNTEDENEGEHTQEGGTLWRGSGSLTRGEDENSNS